MRGKEERGMSSCWEKAVSQHSVIFSRGSGRARMFLASLVMVAFLLPSQAAACAVCYGEPDSPAARGLTWAIIVLGAIVAMVLSGIVMFFVQANRNPLQPPTETPKR
jgi:hypothetical protein